MPALAGRNTSSPGGGRESQLLAARQDQGRDRKTPPEIRLQKTSNDRTETLRDRRKNESQHDVFTAPGSSETLGPY